MFVLCHYLSHSLIRPLFDFEFYSDVVLAPSAYVGLLWNRDIRDDEETIREQMVGELVILL